MAEGWGANTVAVLVLTRAVVATRRSWITVAAITSTKRVLSAEVSVGPENGIAHASVVNLDEVHTLPAEILGEQIGHLHDWQEPALASAVLHAFDLNW